jgi:hypothetical protein
MVEVSERIRGINVVSCEDYETIEQFFADVREEIGGQGLDYMTALEFHYRNSSAGRVELDSFSHVLYRELKPRTLVHGFSLWSFNSLSPKV